LIFGNGFRREIWEEFLKRFNIERVSEFYASTEGNANMSEILFKYFPMQEDFLETSSFLHVYN